MWLKVVNARGMREEDHADRTRIPADRVDAVLSEVERRFLNSQRVAHLATADAHGAPQVLPVCFVLDGNSVYIGIDEKPKRSDRPLKRLRNIAANPAVALVADRYDEDWARLGWVMLRGRAEILVDGLEHARAQDLLRARYEQLRVMQLDRLPVIAVRVERVSSWGEIHTDDPASPQVGDRQR